VRLTLEGNAPDRLRELDQAAAPRGPAQLVDLALVHREVVLDKQLHPLLLRRLRAAAKLEPLQFLDQRVLRVCRV